MLRFPHPDLMEEGMLWWQATEGYTAEWDSAGATASSTERKSTYLGVEKRKCLSQALDYRYIAHHDQWPNVRRVRNAIQPMFSLQQRKG